jgi:hypothetical protein
MADNYDVEMGFVEEVVMGYDVPDEGMDVEELQGRDLGVSDIDQAKCLLCKQDDDEDLHIMLRGTESFVQDCRDSGRLDIVDYINLHLEDTHKAHGHCRRRLSYEARRANNVETSHPKRRVTRSKTVAFSFRDMCFLCSCPCSPGNDMRKVLSGEEFDKRVREVIRQRGFDEWAVAVQGRMDMVNDLFSADAVYHLTCLSRFKQKLQHTPFKIKRGRPQNNDAMRAFERLCDKLELECENEMYTLRQLHDMMSEDVVDDCSVYCKDYLKDLLQKRYGDYIYFASRPGRDDVVGFKNFCDLLLHNKFFSDRNEGDGTEAEKLVQKAAGLIMSEIREVECNRDFYPTADDITCDGLKFVPPLLTLFLKRLIRCPLKQAALGQAIVQSARPQGNIMPLLFGIGVDSAQLGVHQLQLKLQRFGFSVSTDEIRRYKHSIMQTIHDNDTISDDMTIEPIMHFVADNVDHNVRTLDGLGTFHGMGIISASIFPSGIFGDTK